MMAAIFTTYPVLKYTKKSLLLVNKHCVASWAM